jgi:hypothetical protein
MYNNQPVPNNMLTPIVNDAGPTNDTAHNVMHTATTNSNNVNNESELPLDTSNNKSQVISPISKVNTTTNNNNTVVDNQTIASDVSNKSKTTVSSSHNDSKQYEATKFCTLLHHKDDTHYVLSKYCIPINSNN